MWRAVKTSLALSAALALLTARDTSAIKVVISNMCADEFELSHVGQGSVISVEKFSPGSTTTKELPMGTESRVFKAGTGPQATLAEITVKGGMVWYDISIIPTGVVGPGKCNTFESCKAVTHGHSYNFPMQIQPADRPSAAFPTCTTPTCMNDGCPDAYLFPADNKKMHTCGANTDLNVIFCPGGPGRKTPPPTPAPTPTPTPAPTPAPTPEPTTPTPTTPEPTTPAPAVNESTSLGTNGGGFLGGSPPVETSAPVTEAVVVIGATPAPAVQEANTKSGNSSGTSAGPIVIISVGAAAMVAAAAIFVLRKKKAALEAMEQKTPRPTTVRPSHAFMLSTPQESTIL